MSEARNVERLKPRAGRERLDVDVRAGRQPQLDLVAPDVRVRSEQPPQLAEIPTQSVQRILGVGKQQFGQPLAAWGRLGCEEVGQERPCLAPARWRLSDVLSCHGRRAQKVDGESLEHPSVWHAQLAPAHRATFGDATLMACSFDRNAPGDDAAVG